MTEDDEVLARVLRRFLVGDEPWAVGENELTLDGTVEVSDEEAAVLAGYLR